MTAKLAPAGNVSVREAKVVADFMEHNFDVSKVVARQPYQPSAITVYCAELLQPWSNRCLA